MENPFQLVLDRLDSLEATIKQITIQKQQAPLINKSRLLTVKDVAKLLVCCTNSVYKMVENDELPYARIGGRTLFYPDALEKFIIDNTNTRLSKKVNQMIKVR